MRKISGVHKHSSVLANHVETDIFKLQELVDGIKPKMLLHKMYNMNEKHRIKSQLHQCLLNEETLNKSVYWKQAFVSLSKLLEYKNIDMNTYFSLPKSQIKEIVNDFLVYNLQQKCNNSTFGRLLYEISPIVGVYPIWEEGSRKCTTIMAQLRTKHNFLNDTKGRLYKYESPKCSFCDVNECIDHYLYDCDRFAHQRLYLTECLREKM